MKRNVLLKHHKVLLLRKGGSVPLLLLKRRVPRSDIINRIGKGIPNANQQIGIFTTPVAPSGNNELRVDGGKILDLGNSNILKSMNFTKKPTRGKNSGVAKSKVIKIEF